VASLGDNLEQACLSAPLLRALDDEAGRVLVIDPEECIDCGACEPECPVEAIYPEDAVPDKWEPFIRINYLYSEGIPAVNAAAAKQIEDSPPPQLSA